MLCDRLGRNLRKALLMLESCYVRHGPLAEDVEPVMAGLARFDGVVLVGSIREPCLFLQPEQL